MALKIKHLRKVCSETRNYCRGYYSGYYLQLNYDIETGELWVDSFYSLGQNSWRQYHDATIINCGNIGEPKTMQELRTIVETKMEKIFPDFKQS